LIIRLLIIIIFVLSLLFLFFVKQLGAYVYSYVLLETGLCICVLMEFLNISGWGKIAYTMIGFGIIAFSFLIAVITFIVRLFRIRVNP